MSWKRIFGIFLLLIALLLTFLMGAKMPAIDTNRFPITNPVEIPYGSTNFYNITLTPFNKEEYHVDVTISPYEYEPMQVDFWAVNITGYNLLATSLSYSQLKTEYPDKSPFNSIKSHAKEINITSTRNFELTNLDHNGTYCLALVNFFENSQNVTVTVEEKYLGSPQPLLEPSLTNVAFVPAIALVGAFLLIASRRRPSRRAKLNRTET